jgi:hypothetical protein
MACAIVFARGVDHFRVARELEPSSYLRGLCEKHRVGSVLVRGNMGLENGHLVAQGRPMGIVLSRAVLMSL